MKDRETHDDRFVAVDFNAFKSLAKSNALSKYEKIGFPDHYRAGREAQIFDDILAKLPALNQDQRRVVDIGPGCSDLPQMLLNHCSERNHLLWLIDNEEMLALLPENKNVTKVAARFPECDALVSDLAGSVDVVICYSVMHYVILDVPFFRFLDRAMSLLAPGGRLLLGDLPNISMRKRFLESSSGQRFHKSYMQTTEPPVITYNVLEPDNIDDSVITSILLRARGQGFHSYVMPQPADLPMANRREDILIERP